MAGPSSEAGPSGLQTRAASAAANAEENARMMALEAIRTRDLTHPSIPLFSIRDTSWDKDDNLDMARDNYNDWQRQMKTCLQRFIPNVCGYLNNTMVIPNIENEPRAYDNYHSNSMMIAASIKFHCSKGEQKKLDGLDTAHEVWSFLKDRHLNQGTIHRVILEDQLLAIRFAQDGSDVVAKCAEIEELHKKIWAMGPLDETSHLMVSVLSAARTIPSIRDFIASHISAERPGERFTWKNVEDHVKMHEQLVTEGAMAMIASSSKGSRQRNKPKDDSVCTNCKKARHSIEFCVFPGGGMAGKTIAEATKARAEATGGNDKKRKRVNDDSHAHAAVAASTNDGARMFTCNGQTFVAPAGSQQAFLVVANSVQAPQPTPTPNSNLAFYQSADFAGALATDPIESIMSPGSEAHHAWLATTDTLTCSVNWAELYREVSIDAMVTCVMPSTSRLRQMDLGLLPFYLDSGASTHISPDRADFFELYTIAPRRVMGVGGSAIFAIGIGKIKLRVGKGRILLLDNVLFIPNSNVRLLSISALIRSLQCRITFEANFTVQICNRSGAEIATGSLTAKNLYRLHCSSSATEHAMLYAAPATIETWHRRLGHAHHDAIISMATNKHAKGMPESFLQRPSACDDCIIAKQTHSPVPSVREHGRAKRRLDIVWADLTGPEDVASVSGHLYLMNIVDDFSRLSWSIPLKSKSDALPRLKEWHLQVAREVGYGVAIFRTDNGELKSNAMDAWCKSIGAVHQFTAPYTSAHIGSVERYHRTIMQKARAMRIQCKVPANRWDEFCMTACYLSNRTVSSVINMTPYEAWYGEKPNLSHLREIGCRAFVLIQEKHVPKIYPRSIECILIGYTPNAKAYRCYEPKSRRVIDSFNVRFIERKDVVEQDEEVHEEENTQEKEADKEEPLLAKGGQPSTNTLEGPRRSTREIKLSERQAEIQGKPFISNLDKALHDMKESRQAQRAGIAEVDEWLENPSVLFTSSTAADLVSRHKNSVLNSLANPSSDDIKQVERVFLSNGDVVYEEDPTLEQAVDSDEWEMWKTAIADESKSLKEMGVYEPVKRTDVPAAKKVIKGKIVLHRKRNEKGEVVRHKARYVAKGFQQVPGKDFTETTSPTARMESLRCLLHIAAINDWDIQQLDVKTAFLYGPLPENEEVYMEQIPYLNDATYPAKDYVWRLRRGLYGLKQASRLWNKEMNGKMVSWGFKRLHADNCVYYRAQEGDTVISLVHVDDMVAIGNSASANDSLKTDMRTAWTISDLGDIGFCLGISVRRDRRNRTIHLSQTALIEKLAEIADVSLDTNPVSTPMDAKLKLCRPPTDEKLLVSEAAALAKLPYRQVVGTMMYIATSTRPDVSYAVSKLAQYLDCFRETHWKAAVHTVRYLICTRRLELSLGGSRPALLVGYSDSSWSDCLDTRRSTMGYCFNLGSGAVSWSSRKQKMVTNSTTEAEFIAINEACREAMWFRHLLSQLDMDCKLPTTIYCDNNGALALSRDAVSHSRTKHIDGREMFIREQVEWGVVNASRIATRDNISDIFTKALEKGPFTKFRALLGVV